MANLNNLFSNFDNDLTIAKVKREKMMKSRDHLRSLIRDYFTKHHSEYTPTFYIQGSYKMKTMIRTKDDTCDLDDGVYFASNPDGVAVSTIQNWISKAIDSVTDSSVECRKKCITVDYKAGYNIDLPIYLFDSSDDDHPKIGVRGEGWQEDDPKQMVDAFKDAKSGNPQLLRIVKYLKAWCDHKREKMPSGLAMTILAMNHYVSNDRDDVALKFTLINIQTELNKVGCFNCYVPAVPNDNIFSGYSDTRRDNFLSNLDKFVDDARKAVDEEKNYKTASLLWRKHFGERFPIGEDREEPSASQKAVTSIIGNSKPYAK